MEMVFVAVNNETNNAFATMPYANNNSIPFTGSMVLVRSTLSKFLRILTKVYLILARIQRTFDIKLKLLWPP